MYKPHFSYTDSNINLDVIKKNLEDYQLNNKKSEYAYDFQHNIIPVYDLNKLKNNKNYDEINNSIKKDIYDNFFHNTGVIIIKNCYSENIIDKYNIWSSDMLEKCKNDKNIKHPKQSGKYLINDVITRMSNTNSELFMELLFNPCLNFITDLLLGFSKFGSVTGHIINGKGDRQKSHVDYPGHIGSGLFWENNVDKFKNLNTYYQVNNILPYYSLQVLISCCHMNIDNGSTEVVPCSHLLENLDVNIHNNNVYEFFEKYFVNVTLDKGDILLFNRGLCHRGGKNTTNMPRNALIMQCVWLWGIGQEIINYEEVKKKIENTKTFKNMSEHEKKNVLQRLKSPYPINVKNHT